jgi:hypothetical protein
MTRDQAIAEAVAAAGRAKELARFADQDLTHPDYKAQVSLRTAVGALHADLSRAYAAIAAALPDTAEEITNG